MLNQKQKGFALVELLLVLIIIAMLGGIGWYVLSANHETQTQLDNTAQESTTSSTSKTTGKSYLVIKEKGIRFQLNNKIKDAYYFVNKDGFIYFSVHRFDGVKGAERCTAQGENESGGGMVALIATKPGYDRIEDRTYTAEELAKQGLVKIEDTYYGFQGNNQSVCLDTPDTIDKYGDLIPQLKQAFYDQQKTIEKTP